jgi:hypothetical protein
MERHVVGALQRELAIRIGVHLRVEAMDGLRIAHIRLNRKQAR